MEAPKKNRCNGSEAARSRSVFEMGRLAPDYHVILSDFFSSLLGPVNANRQGSMTKFPNFPN